MAIFSRKFFMVSFLVGSCFFKESLSFERNLKQVDFTSPQSIIDHLYGFNDKTRAELLGSLPVQKETIKACLMLSLMEYLQKDQELNQTDIINNILEEIMSCMCKLNAYASYWEHVKPEQEASRCAFMQKHLLLGKICFSNDHRALDEIIEHGRGNFFIAPIADKLLDICMVCFEIADMNADSATSDNPQEVERYQTIARIIKAAYPFSSYARSDDIAQFQPEFYQAFSLYFK